MIRGKIYFSVYLLKQYILNLSYLMIFKVFGAKIGRKTIFASYPEVCGYINRMNIGKGCYIDKNVSFILNKEGQVIIDDNTLVSYNTIINAGKGNIYIGKNSMIAANNYIITNDHETNETLSVRKSSHITKDVYIGDNVWIGANCVILKGVKIGEGSIIGAGSIVTKSIPPYSIAFGNPCKIKTQRYDYDILINKLEEEGYDINTINHLTRLTYCFEKREINATKISDRF